MKYRVKYNQILLLFEKLNEKTVYHTAGKVLKIEWENSQI